MSDEVDMVPDESVGSEQLAAGLEVPAPLDLVSSATGTKPVRDGQEAERSRAHLLLGRQTSHVRVIVGRQSLLEMALQPANISEMSQGLTRDHGCVILSDQIIL